MPRIQLCTDESAPATKHDSEGEDAHRTDKRCDTCAAAAAAATATLHSL